MAEGNINSIHNEKQIHPDDPKSMWYKDALDHAITAEESINTWMTQLHGRTQDSLLRQFLHDWEGQLILPIYEAVHIAAGIANHLKGEDCALLMSCVTVPVREYAAQQAFADVAQLWQTGNIFDLYFKHIRTYNESLRDIQGINFVAVPAMISAFDIEEYMKRYSQFWQEIASARIPRRKQLEGAERIDFSRNQYMLVRPQKDRLGQARISLGGWNQYADLSFRIDLESADRIGVDYCGINYLNMMKIARGLVTIDPAHIHQFTHAFDNDGKRIPDTTLYTPLLARPELGITQGQIFGMIAAVGMIQGRSFNQREDILAHHSYGTMNKYAPHFAEIAQKLVELYVP